MRRYLASALLRRTLKGECNFAAEWVLDTFPEWDVNKNTGKYLPLAILLVISNNLPLVKKLIEHHGADVTMTEIGLSEPGARSRCF